MAIFNAMSDFPQVRAVLGEDTKWIENQLRIELLGLGAINPWCGNDSSPRIQMLLSHLGQSLVVQGTTLRRCMTGIEFELAGTTLSRKLPANARIIRVVEKYPKVIGFETLENPLTVVIYEDYETREIGHIELPMFNCLHQHYGFQYVATPMMDKVAKDSHVPGNVPLLDTPAVDVSGAYCMGVDMETAFMSIPQVIEDGVVLSRSAVKKLISKGYESRTTNWGKKRYPISLYDRPGRDEYKPHPDIGECVRPDGLLFASRTYDDLLAPIEMDEVGLRTPDYIYDKLVYAVPNAKVVDVTVAHDKVANVPPTPVGMETQAKSYYNATSNYYAAILATYNKLKAERREGLLLRPEFHRLVVYALADAVDSKKRVIMTHRNVPTDDWWVRVDLEYDMVPTIGFKLTGMHGNKGVVCDVWEDADMPVDTAGNRAEVISDGGSISKRMNPGVLYEQCINAASRTLTHRLRTHFGLDPHKEADTRTLNKILNERKDEITEMFIHLLGYYWVCSPKMGDGIEKKYQAGTFDPVQHFKAVLAKGVYLWTPTDTPVSYMDVVRRIRKHYAPTLGPVQYRGASGNIVTTVAPVMIGSIQWLLLEKTATDWSGVSSAKLQHFGVPAKLTNADKFASPGRPNPVRISAEAELRAWSSSCTGEAAAEILDQSNNPRVHKHIQRNILTADKPTNILEIVDRVEHPIGYGRNLVYPRNTMECAGFRFVKGDGSGK